MKALLPGSQAVGASSPSPDSHTGPASFQHGELFSTPSPRLPFFLLFSYHTSHGLSAVLQGLSMDTPLVEQSGSEKEYFPLYYTVVSKLSNYHKNHVKTGVSVF